MKSTQPIIELVNVYRSFGNQEVLKGLSFQVNSGEIIGYIGPNGAGKSTTVKIILGLITPDSGEIKVFGKYVKKHDSAYKKRIGYVPENAALFETLTAQEYLSFMGQLYGLDERTSIIKAKKMMELLSIGDSFHTRLNTFSKGMRQKVLIIASLMHNPDILFWDEPLNGLDANSVLIIKEILLDLKKKGKTIFYSSHILDVVEKLSDRILLLQDGKVLANGTFAEISNQKDVSLESLFNDLTGFQEHGQIASDFVAVMMEVEGSHAEKAQ